MKSPVDDDLRREMAEFSLRFTCEACIHYDPDSRACSNGFPTEPHRHVDLRRVREIEFCKLFELA